MKNEKEVQVKQMKRELAGLLESGQDQTARIRVLLFLSSLSNCFGKFVFMFFYRLI